MLPLQGGVAPARAPYAAHATASARVAAQPSCHSHTPMINLLSRKEARGVWGVQCVREWEYHRRRHAVIIHVANRVVAWRDVAVVRYGVVPEQNNANGTR